MSDDVYVIVTLTLPMMRSLMPILNWQRKTEEEIREGYGNGISGQNLKWALLHSFVYASELDSPHEVGPGDYTLHLPILHDHQATQIMQGHELERIISICILRD